VIFLLDMDDGDGVAVVWNPIETIAPDRIPS